MRTRRGRLHRAAVRAVRAATAFFRSGREARVRGGLPRKAGGGGVTCLPASTEKKLGLVIDLDTCVGCQACVTSCKQWNAGGHMAPLTDINPYGAGPDGVWFNRVHTYEHATETGTRTVHFPRSCLHCAEPACVTVCPTGASYKRVSDGIVLVDEDKCIGCKLCAWA